MLSRGTSLPARRGPRPRTLNSGIPCCFGKKERDGFLGGHIVVQNRECYIIMSLRCCCCCSCCCRRCCAWGALLLMLLNSNVARNRQAIRSVQDWERVVGILFFIVVLKFHLCFFLTFKLYAVLYCMIPYCTRPGYHTSYFLKYPSPVVRISYLPPPPPPCTTCIPRTRVHARED